MNDIAPNLTLQWLYSTLQIVRIFTKQETELSLKNRATNLYKRNGVADLKHASPGVSPYVIIALSDAYACMCYHAEFRRSALKYVGIYAGEHQKLGSIGTQLSWDRRLG